MVNGHTRSGWIAGIALAATMFVPLAAAAPVVVHNSLGTASSGSGFYVGTIFPAGSPNTGIIGERFHATVGGTIAGLDLYASANTPRTLTFNLYADVGGTIGSFLESFTLPVGTAFTGLASASNTGSVSLTAGTDYWIVSDPVVQGYWWRALGVAPAMTVSEYYQIGPGATTTIGGGTYSTSTTASPLGMRVTLEAAPEAPPTATPAPPAFAVLLAGVALLGVVRRQSGSAGR